MFSPEESFNPVELEQAFHRALQEYRINGRSRMDVETLLDRIIQNLIDHMNREAQGLGAARLQTTLWTEFMKESSIEHGGTRPFSFLMAMFALQNARLLLH